MELLKFNSKDGRISFEYTPDNGELVVNKTRNHRFVPCFDAESNESTGVEPKFLGAFNEDTGDFYSYPDGILLHSAKSIDDIEI